VYDVDGVLLADMQTRKLHHIRFDQPAGKSRRSPTSGLSPTIKMIAALLVGFLAGLLVAGR